MRWFKRKEFQTGGVAKKSKVQHEKKERQQTRQKHSNNEVDEIGWCELEWQGKTERSKVKTAQNKKRTATTVVVASRTTDADDFEVDPLKGKRNGDEDGEKDE